MYIAIKKLHKRDISQHNKFESREKAKNSVNIAGKKWTNFSSAG
jgi:hypothetical protein